MIMNSNSLDNGGKLRPRQPRCNTPKANGSSKMIILIKVG